jgi:hypothetical protein
MSSSEMNPSTPPDLVAFEQLLRGLQPVDGVCNRDQIMFAAGQAAGRTVGVSGRLWQSVSVVAIVATVSLSGLCWSLWRQNIVLQFEVIAQRNTDEKISSPETQTQIAVAQSQNEVPPEPAVAVSEIMPTETSRWNYVRMREQALRFGVDASAVSEVPVSSPQAAAVVPTYESLLKESRRMRQTEGDSANEFLPALFGNPGEKS